MRKLSLFSLVAVLGVLGCSSGPGAPPAISVSISPGTASVQAGSTAQFTATVTNDSANKGVNWSASCPTAPCGTVSPTSTSSGSATTYTAPSNPPASNLTVTLTATSVADNTKSGTASITVLALTVSVSPATATVLAGATASVTATVANDPGNKGVTWTVSCSAAACGSVSPASTASGAPTTYTAPGPPASNLTVTVKATSVADTTKTASATITVPAITVSVAPATANVPVKGTQAFTATVGNDAGNKGVTWTLTQSGTACSPSCGTIAPAATPSGTPATYTAPATVPSPATVAITATSVADTSKSGTATATVLGITVSVSPTSASVVVNAAQQFTGTVNNDVTNSGVDWTLTQSGAPCSPTCGTVSAHTASGSPATYTAPGTVPSPATLTVTGTSTADPTKSASATVTVTAAPPISVSVAPTTASVAVNATASFTATVTNDPSNSGVTWSLSGAGCSGATCGTLTSVTKTSVTYNAPATVPNPATVTLTATSMADNTKSASATITVTSAGTNNALLNGDYALLLSGFDNNGEVSIAAHIHADGNGNITSGVEDVNRVGSANNNVTINAAPASTYSVGSDRRGTLTLNTSLGTTTFQLVIRSDGSRGRFVEFDDTTGTGTRGSGEFRKQDLTQASFSSVNGDYALGLVGDFNGRLGVVGRLTVSNTGGVSAGNVDVSVPNTSFESGLTGSLSGLSNTTGRGTGSFTVTTTPLGPVTIDVNFYIVDAKHIFVASNDLQGGTHPFLTGQLRQQASSFSLASVQGTSVFGVIGNCGTAASSVAIGAVVVDSNGNVTAGVFDQNECGTINSNIPIGGSFTMDTAVKGRFTFNFCPGPGCNPTNAKPQILYLFGQQEGFLLEGTAAVPGSEVTFGVLTQQSAVSFTEASVAGTYRFASTNPSSTGSDFSGVITLTSGAPSTFSGTLDISAVTGLFPGTAFSGTYALAPASSAPSIGGRFTATQAGLAAPNLIIYASSLTSFFVVDISTVSIGPNFMALATQPTLIVGEQ